ncbi:MAG: hypothetical protein ABUL66_01700, partial [Verrucomicrobiota bacterium]
MKPAGCVCLLVAFHAAVLPAEDSTAHPAGAAAAGTPETPAVFRVYSTTNLLATEFLAGFSAARSNFLAAVQDTFHQATLDEKSLASPDFGYLVTAFNIKNKPFPVTEELAADWARGGSGQATQTRLLDSLLKMEQRYIRPDELPENFTIGTTVRLVPVRAPDEKPARPEAEPGELVAAPDVSAISSLRALFCREFSADEQPLAHAVSRLLQPNCLPDVELTQLARQRATRQSNAVAPFAASLGGKSASSELSPVLPASDSVRPVPEPIAATAQPVAPEKKPAKIPGPAAWLLAAISVVSAALSIVLARRRKAG